MQGETRQFEKAITQTANIPAVEDGVRCIIPLTIKRKPLKDRLKHGTTHEGGNTIIEIGPPLIVRETRKATRGIDETETLALTLLRLLNAPISLKAVFRKILGNAKRVDLLNTDHAKAE